MLDGIKVLNKITEMTELPTWWWIGIVIIVALILIVGISWSVIEKDGSCFVFTFVLGFVLSLVYIAILTADGFQIPTGEYTYQVTIDESVSFKEFDKKYYVIKQDGEIYTIGER